MQTEIFSPEIQGVYVIGKGDDSLWYVTRISDTFRNGGQCATEYEHQKGFTTKGSAERWVRRDIELIAKEGEMQ